MSLRLQSPAARATALVSLALMVSPAHAAPTFSFTDVSSQRGITHVRVSADPGTCDGARGCGVEWAGSVAAEDIDRDGDLDLYFTLDSGAGVLYQNRGGAFVDVTLAAGLGGAPVGGGVSLVDLDGDGDRDLIINPIATTAHPTARPWLYLSDATLRRRGSRPSFTEVGAARGLVAPRRASISGMGIAVGDYDLDGALDVYFADWRDQDIRCETPGARLYRGDRVNLGSFVDATLGLGVWPLRADGASHPYSFGGAFSDVDRDGYVDFLVTSDFSSSELYFGGSDGVFRPGGHAAGVATDRAGMGSTLGDYDNDGDLDLFVSAIYKADSEIADGNRLFRNDAPRVFSDQTDAAGLRDVGWAWGAVLTDLDNDGDLDLCVTSGAAPSVSAPAGHANDETKVFLNPGTAGPWEDVSAAVGVRQLRLGREVVALDYDRDGDQDLLVVPHVGPPSLLRNDTDVATDWLDVRVIGAPGIEAIGAFVEARMSDGRVQVREVGTRAHFTGHGPRLVHFGLGADFFAGGGSVDVHVSFPDGGELLHRDVRSAGTLLLSRASASSRTRAALPLPPANDCDGDGFPDQCQGDCDGDMVPDVCQLADHPGQDCDSDELLDACAISLGFVTDVDRDGTPDICQDPGLAPDAGPADHGVSRDATVDRGTADGSLDAGGSAVGLGGMSGGGGCSVGPRATAIEFLVSRWPWLWGVLCSCAWASRVRARRHRP